MSTSDQLIAYLSKVINKSLSLHDLLLSNYCDLYLFGRSISFEFDNQDISEAVQTEVLSRLLINSKFVNRGIK